MRDRGRGRAALALFFALLRVARLQKILCKFLWAQPWAEHHRRTHGTHKAHRAVLGVHASHTDAGVATGTHSSSSFIGPSTINSVAQLRTTSYLALKLPRLLTTTFAAWNRPFIDLLCTNVELAG